jgi:hypothetical protein
LTSIRCPRSAELSLKRRLVAPLMLRQFETVEEHRNHWYENRIGCVPDHVPGSAVRVAPTSGSPVTLGGVVGRGSAADPAETPPESASAVSAEAASAERAVEPGPRVRVVPTMNPLVVRVTKSDAGELKGVVANSVRAS